MTATQALLFLEHYSESQSGISDADFERLEERRKELESQGVTVW